MTQKIDKPTRKLMGEFAGFYLSYSSKIEEETKEDIFTEKPSIEDAIDEFLKHKEMANTK